jgi:hypothetical protein
VISSDASVVPRALVLTLTVFLPTASPVTRPTSDRSASAWNEAVTSRLPAETRTSSCAERLWQPHFEQDVATAHICGVVRQRDDFDAVRRCAGADNGQRRRQNGARHGDSRNDQGSAVAGSISHESVSCQ